MKILPKLHDSSYTSFDGDSLGYKKWLTKNKPPKIVIIGVHGISGHAGDYENLGKHLIQHHSSVALYAPETRGQGMDPKVERKGDIHHRNDWYKDLYTFSHLLQVRYPDAELVWLGESMGSLIVSHAYQQAPDHVKKPSQLIIASPILDIQEKVAGWKRNLVRATGFLLPKLKVSLETLSNGEDPTVTKQDIHKQQAAINPWYIRRYTLRLLLTLADMADGMDNALATLECPLLIVHGGQDIFTEERSVKALVDNLPENSQATRMFYPDSYHLLMYDHDKEQIFTDLSEWITKHSKK